MQRANHVRAAKSQSTETTRPPELHPRPRCRASARWRGPSRRETGECSPDRLGATHVLFRGGRIQGLQFLDSQADSDHLHGVSPTPRTATTTTLQLPHVIADLSLIRPLLDLLFTYHTDIV